MPPAGKLLAWIEPSEDEEFQVRIISASAVTGCAPATYLCRSHAEARRWAEVQAAAARFHIE